MSTLNAERRPATRYSFTLLLRGSSPLAYLDDLFEAGCDDAVFGEREGASFAEFDREATDLSTAIRSAIEAVESVADLHVVRVEPDELVSASAIALRTGRSRESVRLLSQGKRGPGGFPTPVSWLNDRSKLWRWSEVAHWFAAKLGTTLAHEDDALVIASINSSLERRRRGGPLARVVRDRNLPALALEQGPSVSAPVPTWRLAAANSGGGAAAQGGFSFQNRIGAWIATYILAESEAPALWRLPSGTTFDLLALETDTPVDDIVVGASDGTSIFINAKQGLRLDLGPDSRLASVFDQFVHQYLQLAEESSRSGHKGSGPPARARLVLAVDSASASTIKVDLSTALHALRAGSSPILSQRQAHAISVVTAHLSSSWQRRTSQQLSDELTTDLLRSIWVQQLDLDPGGVAEREAQFMLAQSILSEPGQATAAWAFLIEMTARLGQMRASANRDSLRRALEDGGFGLQASRNYRDDIQALQSYSELTLSLLRDQSEIRIGSGRIKIDRPCSRALRAAAEVGSVVVVGEPGAGKSGALHDLVDGLVNEGKDVVFIATDRLGAEGLSALDREARLRHPVVEILQAWSGSEPAFLVVDALDAARSPGASQKILDLLTLMKERADRWHVVAAIRKFDLRHNRQLQQLFRGTPAPDFGDAEFAAVRHVNVPKLDLGELTQVAVQSPELGGAMASAPIDLADLLPVPYNLRLLAELLDDGLQVEDIATIRTQVDLLDRYWQARVWQSADSRDAHETVLRLAAEEMVRTRSLRANRQLVLGANPTLGPSLTDLLSSHVLVNWQLSESAAPDEYVLTFSHHVLFDYAVARLLFQDSVATHDRLAAEPDLVLATRPSLVFRAEIDWLNDAARFYFWGLVLKGMQRADIPEVAKIVGPEIAARNTRKLEDVQPLVDAVGTSDPALRRSAEAALGHLVGSLLARSNEHPPAGDAALWGGFLERVSRDLRPETAFPAEALLREIGKGLWRESPESERHLLGTIARRLLTFAWAGDRPSQRLLATGLEMSCRTYDTNPTETVALIRQALTTEHLAARGAEELRWIADQVPSLIENAPELVEEIYVAAFGYQEESDETTTFIESRILPMSSHRRQDYNMGLYRLSQIFARFLEHAPAAATRAVVASTEAYYAHSHKTDNESRQEFPFGDRIAAIRTDYSSIWDTYGHDEPRKLLLEFGRHLDQLAADPARRAEWLAIIDALVERNSLAAPWRRLLRSAAKAPETLGADIRPMAWALPILTKGDTGDLAASYVRAAFSTFTAAEKERTKAAIRAIPDFLSPDRRETAEKLRDRLLGYLEEESHQVAAGKDRARSEPTADPEEAEDLFGVRIGEWVPTRDDEEAGWRRQGIDVDAPWFQSIRADVDRAREFAERFLNGTPEQADIDAVLPSFRSLYSNLVSAPPEEISRLEQHLYPWGRLSEAAECVARRTSPSCDSEDMNFIRDVLLRASLHPSPAALDEGQASFDEHPHWGSPAARISAAQGLPLLARSATCLDPTVVEAIQRLASDPVPAVRLQVADHLLMLYHTAPDLMWQLIESFVATESSNGVLQLFLTQTLARLAGPHRDRVEGLTKQIFDRVQQGPGADRVREHCVMIFTSLYLWGDRPQAGSVLKSIASDPVAHSDIASHLAWQMRGFLTRGPAIQPDPSQDEIRHRSIGLLAEMSRSTKEQLRQIEDRYRGPEAGPWSEEDQGRVRSLFQLGDSIAQQLLFASGAFDEHQPDSKGERLLDFAQKHRFLNECGPLIDELAELSLPHVAHQLIETLESLVEVDPVSVFLKLAAVIRAAERGGYQYESLAVDRIVRLVERYLAEYRGVFQESPEARNALVEVLDVFVKAGWTPAVRLTYRLDDVLR